MSCQPRLTLPSLPSAVQLAKGTNARSTSKEPEPTAVELLIAGAHLQRLKDRVRKSMSKMAIRGWKRTPLTQQQLLHPHWIHHSTTYRSVDCTGRPYGTPLPPYHFALAEPCRADHLVKLDWRVTAGDIVRVFRFWENKSALSADNGFSAKCIAELQPKTKRSNEFNGLDSKRPSQHASENITLLVWRLRYILESHIGTAYDQGIEWCIHPHSSSLYNSAANAKKWLIRESDSHWIDGRLQNEPMIITASDILPITMLESRTFHYANEAIHHVIHMSLRLSTFGDEMLFHWRKREEEADAKREQQKPPLQIDDPLEVTMESDDEYMDTSEAEAAAAARRPVWYLKKDTNYDALMRHGGD